MAPRRPLVRSPLTVRLLLVVNSSASSVTARGRVVITKALSADHDVTVAETTRRGHATRLAQGAAADGVDVVVVLGGDGTLNEAANGLAGTDTALAAAARRLDQRVRPHPRPARRPHRGHRRAARRAGPRLGAPGRAGLGQRPLLPLPRRDRLRRRRGERGRAARLAQALRQPPPVRLGRVRHLAAPLRPPQPALLGEGARRGDRRRRPVHGVPQHQPLHVHRHPAVQRRPRGRPRPGPGRGDGAQPRRPSPPRHPRPPRSGRAAACAATATSPTAPTWPRPSSTATARCPYQVDGDYLGDVEHLAVRHEPDVLRLVIPR